MSWWRRLHLGSVAGVIMAGYLAVALAQIIKRNYQLRSQISGYEQQIAKLETEKDELEYKLSYYQTDAFKDKEARAKLGLQQPGENVIILPPIPPPNPAPEDARPGQGKANAQQWWEFLFG